MVRLIVVDIISASSSSSSSSSSIPDATAAATTTAAAASAATSTTTDAATVIAIAIVTATFVADDVVVVIQVGFSAGHVIDDGETLVRRAGRVNDVFQGQGISRNLSSIIQKYFSASNQIKVDTFTTTSLAYDPSTDKSSKILYTTTSVKVRLIRKVRERNVLFNDALNTFYLRLYGVRTYGKGPLR